MSSHAAQPPPAEPATPTKPAEPQHPVEHYVQDAVVPVTTGGDGENVEVDVSWSLPILSLVLI